MGWENPPVSWRELERRLSWNVTRLPPGPERNQKPRRRAGPEGENPAEPPGAEQPWAELHCHSSYSFLDGASSPGELVAEAARLGLRALAVTDHDGMYGVAQFAQAAARIRTEYQTDLATVFGAELSLGSGARTEQPDPPGPHLLVLARGPEGYRRLSRQLAAAHLAGGEKGKPLFDFDALTEAAGGHWHILTGCRKGSVRHALCDGGPDAAERALADGELSGNGDAIGSVELRSGCDYARWFAR